MTATIELNTEQPSTTLPLEQIKDRLEILELAEKLFGKFTPTGNTYKGDHTGAHSSTSNSCLTLYPDSGTWYCYHCGMSGDVIDLIGLDLKGSSYDRKEDFLPAVVEAARRTGVTLPPNFTPTSTPADILAREKEQRLFSLLSASAEYFHQELLKQPEILQFLETNYGFTSEFIASKKLGFAPLQQQNQTDPLLTYLEKAGFTRVEAQAASIINKGGYCRYQGRIMFPYWKSNQVVYFAARATPQTPKNEYECYASGEFKKYRKLKIRDEANLQISEAIRNDVLLGEDTLRLARKKGYVIVTEGIPDQLSAEQAGEPALSPATTRFTAAQMEKLSYLVRGLTVYLCFDNEANQAGEIGATNTARLLEEKNIRCYLIRLPKPEGVEKIDLCDYLKANGGEVVPALLKSALRLPDYLLEYSPIPERDEDKSAFLAKLATLAKTCRLDRVSLETLQNKASRKFDTGLSVVKATFKDQEQAQKTSPTLQSETETEFVEKRSQSVLVMELTQSVELFHTPEQKAYVTYPVDEHEETWPLRSRTFKLWIRKLFFEKYAIPLKNQPLEDALLTLEALAVAGPEIPVFGRIASYNGNIYYDLTNKNWEVVEVTKVDYNTIPRSPVKFRRPANVCPQVAPKKGGKLDDLFKFLNIGKEDWLLMLGWIATAFNPDCQYPVLILNGEQGSAKSTTSRFIRQLLDPYKPELRGAPKDEKDLWISTNSNWIMAYDNLSGIPNWLSDGWCRISTGGGNATRMLYTDEDEVYFDAKRPIILNGIDTIGTRGDLLDRSLIINPPIINEEQRVGQEELQKQFAEKQPYFMGCFFEMVSQALARRDEVKLDKLPRMADFVKWVVAALGDELGAAFLERYRVLREGTHEIALEASPFAREFMRWADTTYRQTRNNWLGTPSDLLEAIEDHLQEPQRRQLVHQPTWPKNARSLSVQLHRLAPNLRAMGYFLQFDVYTKDIKRGIAVTFNQKLNLDEFGDFQMKMPGNSVGTYPKENTEVMAGKQNVQETSQVERVEEEVGTQIFEEDEGLTDFGTQIFQDDDLDIGGTQNIENNGQLTNPGTQSFQNMPSSTQVGTQNTAAEKICVPAKSAHFELKNDEVANSGTQSTQNSQLFQNPQKYFSGENSAKENISTENFEGGEICVPCVTSVPEDYQHITSHPSSEEFLYFNAQLNERWEDYLGLQQLLQELRKSRLKYEERDMLYKTLLKQLDDLVGTSWEKTTSP